MRVASRRVRAGWRVFGDAFERPVVRDHVAAAEGPRRPARGGPRPRRPDRDPGRLPRAPVETRATRPGPDARGLERPARGTPRRARGSAQVELVPRVRGRSRDAPDDARRRGSTIGAHAPTLVRMRAPAVAWEAYQAAWAFEPALPDADVATLHELRIATKWLRYTLEFLRDPMEPQATELIRCVVALQDQLGDIHDLHAAAVRARDQRRRHRTCDRDSGPPSSASRAAKDLRVERLRRRLGPTWRGVADADYRRRLGRSLARL